jgi:hypothetical protein
MFCFFLILQKLPCGPVKLFAETPGYTIHAVLAHCWRRPGTHCTGGWVGPRAGLELCEKSPLPHRDSIPGSSSP